MTEGKFFKGNVAEIISRKFANLIKSLSINLKVYFSHSSFAMLKLHSLYPYIDCQFEIIFFLLISMS